MAWYKPVEKFMFLTFYICENIDRGPNSVADPDPHQIERNDPESTSKW